MKIVWIPIALPACSPRFLHPKHIRWCPFSFDCSASIHLLHNVLVPLPIRTGLHICSDFLPFPSRTAFSAGVKQLHASIHIPIPPSGHPVPCLAGLHSNTSLKQTLECWFWDDTSHDGNKQGEKVQQKLNLDWCRLCHHLKAWRPGGAEGEPNLQWVGLFSSVFTKSTILWVLILFQKSCGKKYECPAG